MEETKKPKEKHLEFNGVRITPKSLILRNAYEGKMFREKIVFQNVSLKPVVIKTMYPNSYISSGHVYAIPRLINFGLVNLSHSVHVRHLHLHNKGYKTTKFEFDLASNELGLTVKPSRGFIPARGVTKVEIELIGFTEGACLKEIWIKAEHPFRISVLVEVIRPRLSLCHPSDFTKCFTPFMFPPIYAGCKCIKSFVVLNYNMLKSTYIVVPEYNYDVMSLHKVKELEPNYDSFRILPEDGILEPSEKREIKLIFQPTHSIATHDRIFFVCYRIIKLSCVNVDKLWHQPKKKYSHEFSVDQDSSGASSEYGEDDVLSHDGTEESSDKLVRPEKPQSNEGDTDFIRLCLYAIVKPVQVEFHPLYFELDQMQINTKMQRSLVLYNKSTVLPIHFQYEKVAYIDIEPCKGLIAKSSSKQITVTFAPKAAGVIQHPIHIHLMYYNPSVGGNSELVVVGELKIPVSISVDSTNRVSLKTKFNMGITPQITNEVGLLPDDVLFSSNVEKPKMAMLGVYQTNPLKRYDDAKIAFPNDRPRSLQPWKNTNLECKTIFAGLPRAIAPPDEYTLSQNALNKKRDNITYYSKYLETLRNKKASKDLKEKAESIPDYISDESKLLCKMQKIHCPPYLKDIAGPTKTGFHSLSPIELYFVRVKPTNMNVGKVAMNSMMKYKFYIENDNKFPVKIAFKIHDYGDKSVFTNLPQEFVVNSSQKRGIEIEFAPNTVGRFNTILNMLLNNIHLLPILFQADVVRPTVVLETQEIIFDDSNPSTSRFVNLINTQNAPIDFSWQIPPFLCYAVQPMSGRIPPNRFISCEICYYLDSDKRKSGKLSISCNNGNTTYLAINACHEKCDVEILNQKIRIDHVPINIPTTRTVTLRNYGYETVLYYIKNPKPCLGVTIEPATGLINGRSDTFLTITVHFEVFVKFECKVEIGFQYGQVIVFSISGCVDHPDLIFKPAETLTLKRVPAESFDIAPFVIQNAGNSIVKLSFIKKLYPEITISQSYVIDAKEHTDISLESGESIAMYLHFFPLDVCINDFYLPIKINNIIGPAIRDIEGSEYARTYLADQVLVTDDENIEKINYKKKLTHLHVRTTSTRHVLRFSKKNLYFKYFPSKYYRSITSHDIKIKNSNKKEVEFGIQIDKLEPNFTLSSSTNANVSFVGLFMVFKMDSEEEITITAKFVPNNPGNFTANLSVYIKDVKDGMAFNYLQFTAKYPPPVFEAPYWLFLQPVPLNFTLEHEIKLTAAYHNTDCSIDVNCEDDMITFFVDNPGKNSSDNDIYLERIIRIQFWSYSTTNLCTRLQFSCTCGCKHVVIITASADESIATTYPYCSSNIPEVLVPKIFNFPYFPDACETGEFSCYMAKVVSITERWLFEQVFYMTYFHFIPNSLTGIYQNMSTDKSKRKKADVLVLVKMLQNITGADLSQYLCIREIPTEELERVHYFHNTFKHAILFVIKQGANIPHVRARYLLSYKDYFMYMTQVRKIKRKMPHDPLDQTTYMKRSTLSWLDLILQIFKSMILSRVSFRKPRYTMRASIPSMEFQISRELDAQSALLHWLTNIYETQYKTVAELDNKKPEDFHLGRRVVTNFTSDLSDGLVLIAVTIYHCPYLSQYLSNIYACVDSEEKAFHNAVQLITAWKLIKCSFNVTPSEIVNPMALQMLMLVTYMYDYFPNLIPKEEITFNISLSCIEQKEFSIQNSNTTEVNYNVQFLNNDMDCFSLSCGKTVKVLPNKTLKLKVSYQAKKMAALKTVMLLCGDMPGEAYSKSIVYILIGEPIFTTEHMDITLTVSLYRMEDKELTIKSPYLVATNYDIWVSCQKPETLNTLKILNWKEHKNVIHPRVMYSEQTKLKCDESGDGILSTVVSCLSVQPATVWIFFSNKDVGDFFIRVTIEPVGANKVEKRTLYVTVPDTWDKEKCMCKTNKLMNPEKCPRRLILQIPCKNDHFWNIISQSLLLTVADEEKEVWKKYIESEMGPYILKWLYSDDSARVPHIFDSDITYNILNMHPDIELPATVTIGNIRSAGYVTVPLHVRDSPQQSNHFGEVSLLSEDGAELRLYKIQFKTKSIT